MDISVYNLIIIIYIGVLFTYITHTYPKVIYKF